MPGDGQNGQEGASRMTVIDFAELNERIASLIRKADQAENGDEAARFGHAAKCATEALEIIVRLEARHLNPKDGD